jgi:uncharacterized protein (DUF1919 family)
MSDFFNEISVFTRRKYRSIFKNVINKKDISLLKDTNFVIVTNNCWGGAVYQWLERPYNSPFVGIGIKGACYLKLISKFDYYMNTPIQFSKKSKYPDREITYPLGIIDDVEIHFTHYKTEEEAKQKWERRTQRMLNEKNKDNYFFKICDSWDVDKAMMKKFHQLPFKNKISFSIYDYSDLNLKNHFRVNQRDKKNKNEIPNGMKLFKLTFLYLNIFQWIKNNTSNKT